MILGLNLLQWITDRLNELFTALNGPLGPLLKMMSATDPAFTTHNSIVMAGWQTMTTVADIFLGLFVIIGAIQMMYGDMAGMLRMTIGQFMGKVLLTALLIHLSAVIGEQLLNLNNLLCGLTGTTVQAFVRGINQGQLLTNRQFVVLTVVLIIVFGIGLFRVLFQAIKRVVRFNLLFVLSGPAFLASVHPATAPVFSSWIRLYVTTIFEQFIQFFTFGLGVHFLAATHQTGLVGFVLATALLNMTAEVPALLARFGAVGGRQDGGLGTLFGTAVQVANILA